MIEIELILIGLFGCLMSMVGYHGLTVYARSFFEDPKATISADIFLALLKGPSSVPVVMCLILLIVGVMFISLPIIVLGLMVLVEAFNSWTGFWFW
jgi:uncharacterized membrane protein